MSQNIKKFNLASFWSDDFYAKKNYEGDKVTESMIQNVENTTGYKLPDSYINFLKSRNGGIPTKLCFPTSEETSWAKDHIAISGIYGIDEKRRNSLLGKFGDLFMKEEWGYPDIGIYICDCPSAGHDMVALDYSGNKSNQEPQVVHVDQEKNYKITFLANNFEEFINGLVNETEYEAEETSATQFIWKPDDISFKIARNHQLLGGGLVIQLSQKLCAGETGWTLKKIGIPAQWENISMSMVNNEIRFQAEDISYYISKGNIGKLSGTIVVGKSISDERLVEIWNKNART